MFRIFTASLVIISVLTGCASSVTPAPSASPTLASATPGPSATPSPGTSPAVTASPSASAPSIPPGVANGALPVRGPGKEIGYAVTMAAGPDGSLFVLVPEPATGVVLARLDRTGRPSPGWPIAMTDVEFCRLLLPVEDGTVRLLCSSSNRPTRVSNAPSRSTCRAARSTVGRSNPGLASGRRVASSMTRLCCTEEPPDGFRPRDRRFGWLHPARQGGFHRRDHGHLRRDRAGRHRLQHPGLG